MHSGVRPVFLILGCGLTGVRVARQLGEAGEEVMATTLTSPIPPIKGVRHERLDVSDAKALERFAAKLNGQVRMLYSAPPSRVDGALVDHTREVLRALGAKLERVVYLSTTGVYGNQSQVDENTPVGAVSKRTQARLEAERAVAAGPWSWLILRPAAIYGPFRGVHDAMRRGEYKLMGEGENFVSRIHAEDLARAAVAGLRSELSGAWPVADEEPCKSIEIVQYCADLLGVPVPVGVPAAMLSETRRSNRRVDGRAIFEKLGVRLNYAGYRSGIPAVLDEERRMEAEKEVAEGGGRGRSTSEMT